MSGHTKNVTRTHKLGQKSCRWQLISGSKHKYPWKQQLSTIWVCLCNVFIEKDASPSWSAHGILDSPHLTQLLVERSFHRNAHAHMAPRRTPGVVPSDTPRRIPLGLVDMTLQVFDVAFCLNAPVKHVGTCVHKTGTFSNLLFHDRTVTY